ncbi:DUF5777 family beta-barrel protein [Solitalea koreensis]|uniref:DUF5777 domain-containing protein n=1 Tax=Solitalea koreensis TaxID=543615 RepID=A0A521AKC7_9SPHI|nr:DUF5777 family beta-barrel protein [Solitalea koreensis]SMO35258.1 hypothetical protein SAMN06265350_101198 [Solitalea koreensis]
MQFFKKRSIRLIFFVCFTTCVAKAQDDPMKMLEKTDSTTKNELVAATFKGTRIINFNSVETSGPRTLEFQIQHRFGAFNSGGYNFFGFDEGASIRFGFLYSYNGRLEFGLGRSSIDKQYDGSVKYRLLHQTTDNHMPLSVTLLGYTYYTTLRDPNKAINGFDIYAKTSSRFSYSAQAIIARKFTDNFSLQLTPVFIHSNLVLNPNDKNDVFALETAGRYKFTKRMALIAEYGFPLNDYSTDTYYNSFGLGLEIETGGHVFQITFTNSLGMTENQFIPFTVNKWSDGGIRLGFNISRVFTL